MKALITGGSSGMGLVYILEYIRDATPTYVATSFPVPWESSLQAAGILSYNFARKGVYSLKFREGVRRINLPH